MLFKSSNLVGLCNHCIRLSADVENQMISVERVLKYAELDPEESEPIQDAIETLDEPENKSKPPKYWTTEGRLEFQNVWLRYRPYSNFALKGRISTHSPYPDKVNSVYTLVNLKFLRIRLNLLHFCVLIKVGIIGPSGAGKSSLISALFRLVEAERGRIFIDSVDISSLPLSVLRRRLSIIPQEPFTFTGTIRQNIDPTEVCGDQQAWEALEAVDLRKMVESIPGKLDGSICEGGCNLSAGQRQLLTLARTIIRGNKILVIDEGTASVDPT
ncbi:unnamed protein product [Protopolystoma xenopodis]|uniref:ABC transporter domain-containing protein n=1 Tax=Protopolystoma xenopodis TaxID=117903 RepID=A0A448WE23_9PLAT|nr:unnamed protein product [Protopolystoma xenopodis]